MEESKENKPEVVIFPDGRRVEISREDLNYIFKGYRPRLMSLEDFKFIRMGLKMALKEHLKGKVVHESKNFYKPRKRGHTYVRDERTEV